MEQLKATFCDHLGDVTSEEFDAYLEQEKAIITAIIDRCDFKLVELEAEYQTFVKVARSYYVGVGAILTMGTYKKLRPNATREELKAIHFAAWMADWISCWIPINDICDGKDKRAGHPALPTQLGSTNAMCLYIAIMNFTCDLISETFSNEPWLLPLLKLYRKNFNILSLACMVDSSCGKYDRRRDPEWYQARDNGSKWPVCVLPVELAFCVAQEPMESKTFQVSLRLANLAGALLRVVDDFDDAEADAIGGRINWAFGTAWEKANQEQRSMLLDCVEPKTQSPEMLVRLYSDLNIKEEFENYKIQTLRIFKQLLDEAPDQVPKKSWIANVDFYLKAYEGKLGPAFVHNHGLI